MNFISERLAKDIADARTDRSLDRAHEYETWTIFKPNFTVPKLTKAAIDT